MIELTRDKKSPTYLITRTDSEGFHHQLNICAHELDELLNQITNIVNEKAIEILQAAQENANPILDVPLTACDISVRTLNLCKHNGVNTLGDLTKLHKTDLLKFRNFGKKSLEELDDLLYANGLEWAKFKTYGL